VSPPFTLTEAGRALGFEDAAGGIGSNNDINCCATHNSFAVPEAGSGVQVAELDSQGLAETLFAEGVISGGQIECSSVSQLSFATDSTAGAIEPAGQTDCYRFEGAAGDRVRLRLSVTGGALSPALEVLRPDGSTVPGCGPTGLRDFTCQLDTPGAHTILVRDAVANTGSYLISIQRLTDDTTAPETTIDSGPLGPTNDPTPTFGFSSSEPGSTFECRVDSQAFAPCASPFTSAILSEGNHSFEVRATDTAGNTDPSPASRAFNVDLTAPETDITSGPAGPTNDPTPTFGFSSSEPDSTFECSLDAGAFAPCPSPFRTPELTPGQHTLAVRAVDAAGNADPSAAGRTWTFFQPVPTDTQSPETTVTGGPSGLTASTDASLSFVSSEAGSTFECRLDGGGFAPCSSPHSYTGLASGGHTFEVRATDPAGNVDSRPATFSWTIDSQPPDTPMVSGPSAFGEDNTPTFTFASTEPGSRFECSLDGGPFMACSSPHTTGRLAGGRHTLAVRAIDAAGNVDPTPTVYTFDIAMELADLSRPTLARDVNVLALRGTVKYARRRGAPFVELEEATQIPVGALLDTRRGTVKLVSATGTDTKTQSGTFSEGIFQIRQKRTGPNRGLTDLRLTGGNFSRCARGGRASARSATAAPPRRLSARTIRRLNANAKGSFRTSGKHSAGTTRGTAWVTSDRCDGTHTKVTRGKLSVRDFRRNRTVTVRAGSSYLARAPR
jgi:hypothetical protein